jgi:hypothetical protein
VLYGDRTKPGQVRRRPDWKSNRLTVSERALKQGGVEFKRRDQAEKRILPHGEVLATVQDELERLMAEIADKVMRVEFVD